MESSPRDSGEFDIKNEKIKVETEKQHNVQNSSLHVRVSKHTGSQLIFYISFLVISLDIKQHGRMILKLITS